MRYLLRAALWGWAADALVLLAFPRFFSSGWELLLLPALCALVALPLAPWLRARERRSGSPRRAAAFALGVLLIAPIAIYLRIDARTPLVAPRLVVLCIDGAPWSILNPLIEAGRLPNLARLIEAGTAGVLESTDPSLSPVVWTTIATGLPPERHGVSSFYSTTRNLRVKRVWDVVEESGGRIGIFRWLVTWPPRAANGFWVPGMLARDGSAFPESYAFFNQFRIDQKAGSALSALAYADYLLRFLRAGLRLETALASAFELGDAVVQRDPILAHVAARRAEIRLDADLYIELLRRTRPDFTTFYDNGTDVLGHRYWKYFEPDLFPDVAPEDAARYGDLIPDFYALADRVVGRMLASLAPETTVVVLSDHGQQADPARTGESYYPRAEAILRALGLERDFYPIVLGSRTFVESVKTDAAERRRAIDAAARRLRGVTRVADGGPALRVEVEVGARITLAIHPEISSLDARVRSGDAEVELREWAYAKAKYSGTHHPDGIFIARGPGIRRGARVPRTQLEDVAPTLLYLMDRPLSRELEGDVIWDAIDPPYREEHPVAWIDSYGSVEADASDLEVDEATTERLRELGYVR